MLKAYNKTVGPIEKEFEKVVYKLLKDQAKRIKKAFLAYMKEKKDDGMTEDEAEKAARKILEEFYNFDDDIELFLEQFKKYYLLSGEAGNQYFNFTHFTKPSEGTLFNIIRDDYLKWLETYGGGEIRRVNDTTKQTVRSVIKDGLINGEKYDTMADTLVEKIDGMSKGRAKVIAETETHNTFMHANMMSAEASGFKKKQWISMRDESVRDNHRKYNDMGPISIDQEFAPGLMYPGDSNAPAKEVVRCRCVMKYTD